MPVHDWTRVEAGIFHAFHVAWIGELCKTLNREVLPEDYYALAEQHMGRSIPDVLTLHESSHSFESSRTPPSTVGTAVAEAPPKTRRHLTIGTSLLARRRSVAVRHVSGHRLIALVEILSPANKDRRKSVDDFASKAVDAINADVNLLLVDLFPPGPYDPHGIHGVIRNLLESLDEPYDLPFDEPLTLASYAADEEVDVYLEHLAPGTPLAEMPLFLNPDRYVETPLESTYMEAFRGMPDYWRNVLEGGAQG